eukprot:ANDGO_08029.mRNA.1 putative protein tyrosine phosphatase type IVA A
MSALPNKPSVIETHGHRFLIFDAPSNTNLAMYIKEMKAHHVTHLCIVCDCTYTYGKVADEGIAVHYWPFQDGDAPPAKIVDDWLSLVIAEHAERVNDPGRTIAVHCVAGLGRAPVLVAIALIEAGMEPLDAITFIRERRRGAINSKQMRFLESYKPRHKGKSGKCCVLQ